MEHWREVWREAAAPRISTPGLLALRDALARGEMRLIHGATTLPPPMACVWEYPCEGACLIAYAGWKGDGIETVKAVRDYFEAIAFGVNRQYPTDPGAVRWLTNAWDCEDGQERDDVRREMLAEVNLELVKREEASHA